MSTHTPKYTTPAQRADLKAIHTGQAPDGLTAHALTRMGLITEDRNAAAGFRLTDAGRNALTRTVTAIDDYAPLSPERIYITIRVIDADGDTHRAVEISRRNHIDLKGNIAPRLEINWSAWGGQPVATAARFAECITLAARYGQHIEHYLDNGHTVEETIKRLRNIIATDERP